MTLVLVQKLLRDARWPLLAVCLLLFIFSAFWVKIAQRVTTEIAPFFNGLAAMQNIDKKLLEEVVFKGPGKISQAVLGGAEMQFDKPNDFLAVEMLHPVVIILVSLWAVGRAGAAISGELDRGTMELLLSQPVPRNRLILAHFIVDCIVIPVICCSIIAGTQTGLAIIGPFEVDYTTLDKIQAKSFIKIPRGPAVLDVTATRQVWATINLAALMFAISGLAMAISAMGRSRWRTIGIGTLVGVTMFTANVIGQLWEGAAMVRPFTVFFYYQPQKIWLKHIWTVDLGEGWATANKFLEVPVMAVLLSLGTLGYLVALRIFTRRDLPAPL